MEIFETILFLSIFFNFLLSLFVYLKDPKKKINQLFGVSGLITGVWIFSNLMMGIRKSLFWLKTTYAFGALVPLSALFWILEFCQKKIERRKMFLLSTLGIFFFIISYFNKLFIVNVEKVYLGGFEGKTGPFFIFYWFYIGGILAIIFFTLFSQYFKSKGIQKFQIGYVILGSIFYGGTAIAVNIVLPLFGIYKFLPLDSPSSLLFLFFTTLAITKYHLFGIRIILTEILVGIMGVILFLQIIFAQNLRWRISTLLNSLLFLIFAFYLLKSIHEEEKRREEAERLVQKKRELTQTLEEKIKEKTRELEESKTILEIKVAARTRELRELAASLDQQVKEKTKELQEKVNELETSNRLMVGRELKMVELKEEIKRLREELEKYKKRN